MPLHMHLRISLIQRPDEECQEFVYDSMKVFLNVFEAVSRGLHVSAPPPQLSQTPNQAYRAFNRPSQASD